MATAVLGIRYRGDWSSPSEGIDDPRQFQATADTVMSRMNGSPAHDRSYSGVHDRLARPRLPSISNLFEGAGRPDLTRPPFQDNLSAAGAYQARPDPGRTTPISTESYQPWSPSEDFRQKQKLDHRPNYISRNSTDNIPEDHRYLSTDNVVLPHILNSDTRGPLHYSGSSLQDPSSPDSRTTAKHVVREEHIPGKGLCYIYDDGSVCQKVINGDTVNPKWGTTKAGKPRKRLGQACNTCREKKIKCDPSYPKCSQCQKFSRECRFEPASRTSLKSPKMRPVTSPSSESLRHLEESASQRKLSVAPTDISSPSDAENLAQTNIASGSVSGNNDFHEGILADEENRRQASAPLKRVRVGDSPTRYHVTHEMFTAVDSVDIAGSTSQESFTCDIDPFLVDDALTRQCLATYFSHIEGPKYSFLPKTQFMRWAETARNKTPEAKLVLYGILAVGAALDPNIRKSGVGQRFRAIAATGVTQTARMFSLELIHARLIFCMSEFHAGNIEKAWDLCGAALRAACALNLHTETGVQAYSRELPAAYDLDPVRLAESIRRTFWILFLQDQFGVVCLTFHTTFSKADLFICLPTSEEVFDKGLAHPSPFMYMEDGVLKMEGRTQDAAVAALARQIHIASLCCDIHVLATRAKQQASLNGTERCQDSRRKLEQQLDAWEREYSAHLISTNGRRSADEVDGSTCGGLHIMYHHACMELNRHIRHARLSARQIMDHSQKARYHACRTLDLAHKFVSYGNMQIHDYATALASPVTGHAILTALDILTAAGLNADLLEDQSRLMGRFMAGIEVLDKLSARFISAKKQQDTVSERIKILLNSVRAGVADRKVAFYITEPMAVSFGLEDDLVYGVDRIQFLRATDCGDGAQGYSDLVEVNIKEKRQ